MIFLTLFCGSLISATQENLNIPIVDKHPMSIKELMNYLDSDISRYKATGTKSTIRIICLYQAFWATSFYRVFQYLYIKTQGSHMIRFPVAFFYHIGAKIIQILTGISIPVGTRIGKGLYLAHYGPIFVAGDAMLGDNCNLGNQVILGFGWANGKPGAPIIGNRVFIGPGAKIFGPVRIGNDASIGANAVVTHDVPDRAFVAGIPAKIINYHGSFRYIKYAGLNQDIEREESWKLACHLDPSIANTEVVTIHIEN